MSQLALSCLLTDAMTRRGLTAHAVAVKMGRPTFRSALYRYVDDKRPPLSDALDKQTVRDLCRVLGLTHQQVWDAVGQELGLEVGAAAPGAVRLTLCPDAG